MYSPPSAILGIQTFVVLASQSLRVYPLGVIFNYKALPEPQQSTNTLSGHYG